MSTRTVAYSVSFLSSLESPDLQFFVMFFLRIFRYLSSEQPLQVILSFAIAEVLEFMHPGYFYPLPSTPPSRVKKKVFASSAWRLRHGASWQNDTVHLKMATGILISSSHVRASSGHSGHA